MNQQSFGQKTGPDTAGSGHGTGTAEGPGSQAAAGKAPAGGKASTANEAVLGPFTIRDLTVFGGTLILFVASLLPIFGARYNLWNLNNLFFLGLGIILPLIVSALFAARRLSPATKIRIGSLSIDQFGSVVASFAVAFFFVSVAGAYVPSLLVGLIGSLVLFAATVLGRFLPYLSTDFQDRAEVLAHIVAREAAVPVQKPRAPKKPKAEAAPGSKDSKPGSKILSGAGLFGGAGAGSSAVQPGSADKPASQRHQDPVVQQASQRPGGGAAAAHAPATAAVPTAAAPVSTAPEVSDWTPAGDAGPATQAADVVRPSSTPAAEETRLGDVPAAAGATSAAHHNAMPNHDGGTHPAAPSGQGAAASGQAARSGWEPTPATAVHQQVRTEEPIGATVDPSTRPDESEEQPIHEAFWFAVAQHRTAYDPRSGAPAFVIEPGGWVLALEDRGHEFLVQHTDGRLGVLRDLSNIERG
ncbi:NADH-quinone oxidoreductase subunit J [Pseudarthrobacter sp. NPDC092184]|uniref:NADH-quinone oxidoreductase subunit J n=1 Tax=unclassified Pseudarthrobacter TaxID=2647000 RepID=UPI003805536C